MLTPEGEDEEFQFYLKFAKPLVLNLPDTSDRIKAATWIRYLKNDTTDSVLRGEYLKLLLFVLQRRKLFGPFASIPDESKPLEKFPEEINIQDVAKNFVEVDKQVLKATLERGGYGEWPPYTTACSSDLTEYASSQEMPNFGVQAFFAISRDPLPVWDHYEKAMFPIGENIETIQPESYIMGAASPDIGCFVSPDHGEPISPPSPPRPIPRISPGEPKDDSPPKGLGDVSPKAPKEKSSALEIDEFNMDPRVPPSWGSNLVNVKDSPSPTFRPASFKDLAVDISDHDMLDFFNDDIDLFEADLDEASSYLQGDTFTSPPRAHPTSPMSPPSSPSYTRPAGTPPKQGPYPEINIDDLYDSMSKYVDEDFSFSPGASEATCPGQPCPGAGGQEPFQQSSVSPEKLFDALEHIASDKDTTREGRTSLTRTPTNSPRTSAAADVALEVYTEKSDEVSQVKDVTDAVQQILEEMNQPSVGVLQSTGNMIEEAIMNQSGEGLGGDSFIDPDQADYRWLDDMPPGTGIPQDEQQDPALWDSFGWWTDDPDEIFTYFPPSPRVYGTPEPDPYAAQRKRWADVPPTPPIFSKDPKIREGLGAQRQYAIEEFGMESFEEPVWTSADQYFKYKREASPFIDHRQIDRKTLDPSQFPKYESPKMQRQLTDIQGLPEEEDFFDTDIAPDLINVSFGESDFQKMTKVQAAMEAVRHGPRYIGVPTSTPEKSPEDEGPWEEMGTVAYPPAFMLEPGFLSTPPDYEPNLDITVDELEDSISRYIEEDLKTIHAKIPATTPQRSPSPKRLQLVSTESPPFVPDIDVEPDPPSPELVSPEKHEIPVKRQIDWDTEIGSPLRFKKSDVVVIESEDALREKNLKRKQQLKLFYEREFGSPPKIPTPPPMPHLMDEPISRRLPAPMTPKKLPPPRWDWVTPPKYEREPYVPRKIITPTGISPIRPISQDISMFFESPPEELLSPTMAVSSLMFSPPEGFGQEDSPVRSPGGTPQDFGQYDAIDMEEMYSSDYDDFDSPELYHSPEELSPERQEWKDRVGLHEKTPFRRKTFVVRPKPGRSYRITGSRIPSLGTLTETSPPEPQKPDPVQAEMEAEIAALEAELFPAMSPREPRPPAVDDSSPDYERKIWQESIKLQDTAPYMEKKIYSLFPSQINRHRRVVVGRRSKPPTLPTIHSPRSREFEEQERQDYLRDVKHRAKVQVTDDKEQMKKIDIDYSKYNKIWSSVKVPWRKSGSTYRAMLRPKLNLPRTPPKIPTPPSMPHLMDEPISRRLPAPMAPTKLPPPRWDWETPPKYKREPYVPRKIITPTGISPIRPISQDISMFFESPPEDLLSPTMAVSSLMFSPPEGFGQEDSPVRSPGGTPQDFGQYDAIDMEEMFSSDYDDFDSPELYHSPEELSPERQEWKDRVGLHEKTPFRRKTFVVQPKPGRSYIVTGSRRPSLETLVETSPPEPQRQPKPQRQPEPRKVQTELEAEIAVLEAELFPETPVREPRQPAPDDISPDYERKIWQESIKLQDTAPYMEKKIYSLFPSQINRHRRVVVGRRSKPPTLPTIHSPRSREFEEQERQDYLRDVKHRAKVQVTDDKEQMKKIDIDYSKYNKIWSSVKVPWRKSGSTYRAMLRPKLNLPRTPPKIPTPPSMPHLMDEPISRRLPAPMAPTKLPPPRWDWETPPKYKREPYVPRKIITPTGISPIRPISQDISMFFESPPEDLLSPTMAVSSLMFSPPEGFGQEDSPVRSPGGTPQDFGQYDAIDMEEMYSSDYDDFDSPELYHSPEELSPERQEWKDRVELHEKTPFRRKTFVVRPKPGRSYRITGSRIPSLGTLTETSPPDYDDFDSPELYHSPEELSPERQEWKDRVESHEKTPFRRKTFVIRPKPGRSYKVSRSRKPALSTLQETSPIKTIQKPQIVEVELKREIAALEAELRSGTPGREPRQSAPDDISPEYDRKMWQESIKSRDTAPYMEKKIYSLFPSQINRRRRVVVGRRSKPPTLPTIYSPSHPDYEKKQREDKINQMKLQADKQVLEDMKEIKAGKIDNYRYRRIINDFKDPWRISGSIHRAMMRPNINLPPSPPQYVSPERPPDDAMVSTYPPVGWTYETPPQMKYRSPVQRKMFTPADLSPLLPPRRSLLYESPPMMFSEDEYSPSPIRSPGGRPIAPPISPAADDFAVAPYYSTEYGELDEEPSPELYSSPEYDESEPLNVEEFLDEELEALEAEVFGERSETARQVLSPTRTPPSAVSSVSPATPEYLRKAWMQDLSLRDNVPYRKQTFTVKPTPGKSYRMRRRSRGPDLESVEEKYYELSPLTPPLKPRPPQPFQRDAVPPVTVPPENWSWKTPSPITRRGLYGESPPLVYSPGTPPEFPSPESASAPTYSEIALSRTPTEESLSISVYRKPQARSPLRSPGGRPGFQQDRPLDAIEMAQVGPADYDILDEESPELYDYSQPTPPAPPPRPRTPSPYYAKPRRIPRQRGPLDPNVLYADTPQSASKRYQPKEYERVRFESTRPVPIKSTTPPPPPKTYYETPIASGAKPWKKRRKPIERTAKRKLEFDDDEKEFEREMIEELEAHILAASPTEHLARDVMGESPPSTSLELDEVSMLGDFDYEPAQFNMYADDDIPQYEQRPAFEGQPDVDLMDTSMIQSVDDIPYEERDFRWMDKCETRCPWK